jgi:Flp pilus assembly protein TadD
MRFPHLSPLLLALLSPLAIGVLAGAWLAYDWWDVDEPDQPLTYVGREECRRCHEQDLHDWTGSDHDLAMDRATPEFVVGDFDDITFIRVPAERLPQLGSEGIRLLAERTEATQWGVALKTADDSLRATLLEMLPDDMAREVRRAMDNRAVVRPCDATTARYHIGREAARLIADGRIDAPEMHRSRFYHRPVKDDANDARIEYLARTDGPDGHDGTFRCEYTFGVRPLQQFLVPMERGRYQCLPLAWDTLNEQWFHLYPDEPIPHHDVLHWTGPLQNWNYMCADCHSTNLQKGYDVETDTYHTTFSEIDVSCEACHGPGSLHVELSDAWSPFWDRKLRYGLPNLKSDDSRVEIETCAPCHARRRIIYPGFKPGDKFLDHFMPELLDGNLYYADGQILEEDYVYGSFIQSLMYRNKVRCTDCHDPHSARVKFDDNRLCGQCHVPAKYDTPQHHHHPDASQPGTLCVECHMPETTYMVVDARRDHSLRIPRPDLTVSLGIPNACTLCHDDASKGETPEWAAEKCEQWYGDAKQSRAKRPPHFAHAIAAGRSGRPEGRGMLQAVARRADISAMVRASALVLLGRYPSEQPTSAQIDGLDDEEDLVRAAAVRSFEHYPQPLITRYLPKTLSDPRRAVRTEAARLLSATPRDRLDRDEQQAYDRAIEEYFTCQRFLADQPAAHLNMAVVLTNQGKRAEAVGQYEIALRLDPEFIPARINLGMLQYEMGNNEQAETQLRRAIELAADHSRRAAADESNVTGGQLIGQARYSLGLLLAEDPERLEEAAEVLRRAVDDMPENARVRYNLGLALQHLDRRDEAEGVLREAYELAPANPDYLGALAILYAQQGRWSSAVACAKELVRRHPDNRQFQAMLSQFQQQAGGD